MIATIVCALLLIAMIALIIFSAKMLGEFLGIEPVLGIAALIMLSVSLFRGYTTPNPDLLEEKEDLIVLYKDCPCERHMRDAIDYNYKVEVGNNIWCRFTIEDRSEYKIDITELLNFRERE